MSSSTLCCCARTQYHFSPRQSLQRRQHIIQKGAQAAVCCYRRMQGYPAHHLSSWWVQAVSMCSNTAAAHLVCSSSQR